MCRCTQILGSRTLHILGFRGKPWPCVIGLHTQVLRGHVTRQAHIAFSSQAPQREQFQTGMSLMVSPIYSEQRRAPPQLVWVVPESLRGYSAWGPRCLEITQMFQPQAWLPALDRISSVREFPPWSHAPALAPSESPH